MFAYRAPGVYFEWLDSRAPAIDVLRTDIAGFAGIASRGPLHRPVKIERTEGEDAVVASGLEPGERVVTTGFVRLAQGVKVTVEDAAPPPERVGVGR